MRSSVHQILMMMMMMMHDASSEQVPYHNVMYRSTCTVFQNIMMDLDTRCKTTRRITW